MFFSIIAIAIAVVGFISGSLWLFSAAVGFLFVTMYPVFTVVIAIVGIGLLALKDHWRQ